MSDCHQTVGSIPPPPAVCSGVYYIIQRGDTLSTIAQRFVQMTVQNILNANPQITDPNVIFVGQIICIPHNVAAIVAHPQLRPAIVHGCDN